MLLLDLTLPTPAENVALDDALLELAERGELPGDLLRIWESPEPMVVVGRSSQLHLEVELDACRQDGVSVVRRASGGAAIVAGPGCLMYAVVLAYAKRDHLRALDMAHGYVLERVAAGLARYLPGVARQGTSDLTLGDRKFSGNSMRCRREHLLYHGTLLYDFPLEHITRYLKSPPRQPEYRARRSHQEFVTQLPLSPVQIKQALIDAWQAHEPAPQPPMELVAELVREKYGNTEWNL